MIHITAVAVTCSRQGTYDAEIQLQFGDFEKPEYFQYLISSGHKTSKEASAVAEAVTKHIQSEWRKLALDICKTFTPAKE